MLNQIKLELKTSDYQVYIPGSSIKGALRTAWLYKQCCNGKTLNDESKKRIEEEIKQAEQNRYDAEKTARFVDERIAGYSLGSDPPNDKYDFAIHNLFRVLQIKDSQLLEADKVLGIVAERMFKGIIPVKTTKTTATANIPPPRFDKTPNFYEVIQPEVTFEGRLSLDRLLLEDNRAKKNLGWYDDQVEFSLDKLCQATNQFAKDICEWETNYFGSFPQSPMCNIQEVVKFYQDLLQKIKNCPSNTIYLSLGHGSGWHKLTIGLLLQNDPNWQKLADTLKITDNFSCQYPKTRKLPLSN
ncbi:MAG: hypothetical protein FD167_5923, partial [bacterium]